MIFDDQFPGSGGRGVTRAENLGFLHFSFGGGEGEVEEIFKLGVWHGVFSFGQGCGFDIRYSMRAGCVKRAIPLGRAAIQGCEMCLHCVYCY